MRWLVALTLLLCSCREKLALENFAHVRVGLPAWKDRVAQGTAASGSLERRERDGASVSLTWDADERTGAVTEADALVAAALGAGASVVPGDPDRPRLAAGHSAVLVAQGDARALVWRCERSRRLFRLSASAGAAGRVDLDQLATHAGCHAAGDKPVNGDVPIADLALLGEGWSFARRQSASAAWLQADAVLTLFAGERNGGPKDAEAARATAVPWARAAGLRDVKPLAVDSIAGPSRHPALRVVGRATLEGRAVRFSLIHWRCLARGKNHAAIVFTTDAAPAEQPRPGEGWTTHDAALLATRCHG